MRELKVGLVGGGFMGKAHSLAYALAPIADDLGATIIKSVLVDANATIAASLAQQLGWESSSGDWRDVVNDPDIDIIDICTPPQFHKEIALAAIAAGKHVFCEKPLANSIADSEEMRDAALRSNVVVQVGYNYRHTPAVAFAKRLLDSGALGQPLEFRASYLQEGGFSANPALWRSNRATGGSGMIGDIGSHIIDAAEYLFGDITKVAARVRTYASGAWVAEQDRLDGDLLDDAGVWVAEFANGAIGSFAVSRVASGRKNRLYYEFDATKGAVEFDWNNREEFRVSYVDEPDDHQGFRTIHTNTTHPNGWWRLAGLGTGYLDVSTTQFQKFVKSILTGAPVEADFVQGTHVQQVVEAVLEAARTDSWVAVPARVTAERIAAARA